MFICFGFVYELKKNCITETTLVFESFDFIDKWVDMILMQIVTSVNSLSILNEFKSEIISFFIQWQWYQGRDINSIVYNKSPHNL